MARSRRLWLAAQWVFAAAVIWYAARSLSGQWTEVGERLREMRPAWSFLVAASMLVLLSYGILIEAWRRLLATWSARLSWPHAARIWLASNLGKYVPGKIWSILALGALAKERGASALAAGGSSVVMQLLSVITGITIAVALGTASIAMLSGAVIGVALLVAAIAAAPRLLPYVLRHAGSLTGRSFSVPALPRRTLWIATATTIAAWVITGVAFRLFCEALGLGRGSTTAFISVYAASYVAGFIALFAPGGIGVREGALVATMQRAGLATPAEAAAIAVASRIWLTVLEVLPGLIALAVPTKTDGQQPATHERVGDV